MKLSSDMREALEVMNNRGPIGPSQTGLSIRTFEALCRREFCRLTKYRVFQITKAGQKALQPSQ